MSVGDHYPEHLPYSDLARAATMESLKDYLPHVESREFTMNQVEARSSPIMHAPDGARVAALEARAKVAEEKLESVEAHFKTMHIQYDRLAGDVRWLKSRIEDLEAPQNDQPTPTDRLRFPERDAVVARLRELCRDFGDNDWPNELHLGDVIEKHLWRHLYYARERLTVAVERLYRAKEEAPHE